MAQKESVRLTEPCSAWEPQAGGTTIKPSPCRRIREADIPQLEAQLITNRNALCVLLGIPRPHTELAPGWVPQPPQTASVQRWRLPCPQRGKRFLRGQRHTRRNAPPNPLFLWT
ncbi:MAG: hypothetical protein ACLSHC_05055 [Bilophila wadsworthia]